MRPLIIFLVFFHTIFSQNNSLLPFFENYSKSEYLGENQNWSGTQDKDGVLYFANNKYMLRFNGASWSKFQLPEKTIIRSVMAEGDSIFSGSFKEFGYWKFNDKLEFQYHSLTQNKNLFDDKNSEEIWKIFKLNDEIIFQSFSSIYSYKKGVVKNLKFNQNLTYCYNIDNQLYVSSIEGVVYQYKNGKFITFIDNPLLSKKIIHAILKVNRDIWIFTLKDGVFIYKNNELKAWNHPLNEQLKTNLINCAERVGNSLIVGTVNNGVLLYDYETSNIKIINKEVGILNNSILSIFNDSEKNIWLSLDNGICYVEKNSPILIYNDFSGKLGSVYGINFWKNSFLLASNHGLFNLNQQSLNKVPNSEGLMWNIENIGAEYICGGNDGTYSFANNQLTQLNHITGGWKFKKIPNSNHYIQATYTGLYLYQKENSGWKTTKIPSLTQPIKNILIFSDNIFAVDNQKGIYLVKFNPKLTEFNTINLTRKSKINDDYNCSAIEINGQPYFLIKSTWYEFDVINEVLKPNIQLNQSLKDIQEAYNINNSQLAIISNENLLSIVDIKKGKFIVHPINEKYYAGKLIQQYLSTYLFDNHNIIATDDGFLFISNLYQKNISKVFPRLELLVNGTLFNPNKTIPERHNSIEINVITGIYGYSEPIYYYDINDSKRKIVIKNKIDLSNLNSGKHKINIYQLINNKYVLANSLTIKIAQPWYFSLWAFLFYTILIVLGFYLYYRFNQYKYIQKLKLIEEEAKHLHAIELLEQKKETEKAQLLLDKKSLEMDYAGKSNELAFKALSLAKYSELEEELNKILQQMDDVSTKNKILKLLGKNKIDKEMKVFEDNLNIVHQDFIKRLLEKYPNLSPKDLQLSIYLRMNLSSKEIAPLMAITFRGVEIHRYRLRKKLSLASEINLSKYMINF